MKVLLVLAALTLLQRGCPGSARSVPPPTASATQLNLLQEMYRLARWANATVPGLLRTAMVPVIEECKKDTFCEVQMTLRELPANDYRINTLCDSLMLYGNHTHMNCTDSMQNKSNATFELQELFIVFMDCINKEVISL